MSLNRVRSIIAFFLATFLVACGGNGDDRPYQSAAEVMATYNAAPQILMDRTDEVGEYVEAYGATHVSLWDSGQVIYDEVMSWPLFGYGYWDGILSSGKSIRLLTEYRQYEGVVELMFLGTQKLELKLHAERDGTTRKVFIHDIRESGDWLLIKGSVHIRPRDNIFPRFYWAVYNVVTGEFIDYGPDGS